MDNSDDRRGGEVSKPGSSGQAHWSRIVAAIGSPLKLFALIVLGCNTVFGVAAATMSDAEAFMYTIHMFLAIVASFVLIALWSPRSLYHPKELAEIEQTAGMRALPPERPAVATAVLCAGVLLYGMYQFLTK